MGTPAQMTSSPIPNYTSRMLLLFYLTLLTIFMKISTQSIKVSKETKLKLDNLAQSRTEPYDSIISRLVT